MRNIFDICTPVFSIHWFHDCCSARNYWATWNCSPHQASQWCPLCCYKEPGMIHKWKIIV